MMAAQLYGTCQDTGSGSASLTKGSVWMIAKKQKIAVRRASGAAKTDGRSRGSVQAEGRV